MAGIEVGEAVVRLCAARIVRAAVSAVLPAAVKAVAAAAIFRVAANAACMSVAVSVTPVVFVPASGAVVTVYMQAAAVRVVADVAVADFSVPV